MRNNSKILIATGIYPPDYRGPATLLEALPAALRARGFEVKIITYSNVVGGEEERKKEGVWRISRKQNVLLRYVKYFLQMRALARWSDIIYATDTYSVGYFAYLLKKFSNKKYIIRFAGDSAWETASARGWTKDYIVDFQEKKYEARIEKLKKRRKKILVNADKIIAVSNFIASVARRIGVDGNKIKVIYNSIDFIRESDIDPEAARNIGNHYSQGDAKIIVTACQLMPWKGVDGIIKILPALKEKIGPVSLLVLGEGQELENLQKLSEGLGVSEIVYFLGKIEHKNIINYYKAADLFILNTNYEALSYTLLEVMKVGTPIITTNIGGNPEVIDDNKDGLLVTCNDEKQLADAAIKILSDEEFAEKLTNNSRDKLQKFNWDSMVNQTIETIENV